MTLRYAAWCAVSTREQAGADKFSLPLQIERTQAEAARRGWARTAGPYVVDGHSREIYIDLADAEREIPALHQMLDAARHGLFDVLVMTELDRLRSLQLQVLRTLARCRVQIFATNLPIEPMPPDQYSIYRADTVLMMMSMTQVASSLEISRMRRKWFESMPKRVSELGLPATSIPYGYRKPPGRETDRKAVPEPDPVLSAYVVEMKDRLLAGWSTRQIAGDLNQRGVRPPKGREWYPQTVRGILRNPFYSGSVSFGASRVYVDPLTDKPRRDRSIPHDQVLAVKGRHQPIWSDGVRHAILAALARRQRNYRGRANNQLTGLLECGVCGQPLWRQGNGPRGEQRLIWRCSSTGSADGHLNVPHVVLYRKVSSALVSALVPRIGDPAQDQPLATDRRQVEAQLADLRRQHERLEKAYIAGVFDLEQYSRNKWEIDEQIERAQAEIYADEQERIDRTTWLDALAQLGGSQKLEAWLQSAEPSEINRRLHLLVHKIVVSTETVEIQLK